MIKKVLLLLIVCVAVSSCGVKKRTTYAQRTKTSPKVSAAKQKINKDLEVINRKYPLPVNNDNGKFKKYPVANVQEYISNFSEVAKLEMKAFGIPASITLAQGLLESGAGKGELTIKTNNHFGIKCHVGWEGEYDFHDDDEKGECFRKYNHPMFSFRDHSMFLSSRSRYAFLFGLKIDDYKGWANGLKEAGYATDKKYPQKLIYLIEKHNLDKFDKEVLKNKDSIKKEVKELELKVHVVEKGDTLYSLSRKYFISVPEIMRINKLKNSTIYVGDKLIVKSEKVN